jgi:hypothetical protein
LGVRHLIAHCLNDACRHQPPIDVSNVPKRRAKFGKYSGKHVDVVRVT